MTVPTPSPDDRGVALFADGTFSTRVQAAISALVAAGIVGKADAQAVTDALAAKADASTVTTALAAKADTSALTAHATSTTNPHAVTKTQVGLGSVDNTSDAAKPVSTAQATALAAKADLVGGTIPTSQMPSLSLVTTVAVANATARYALTSTQVQPGDVAVQQSTGQTFMLIAPDPSQVASWTELPAIGKVQSVNGQQGVITLGPADVGATPAVHATDQTNPHVVTKTQVGLGSVDNTSDAAKPVSTAQQSALDAKVTTPSGGTDGQVLVKAGASVVWSTIAAGDSANLLGTPSNPVTSASAARPTGLTVVYWSTATQPTNWTAGDVWTAV